MPVSSATRSEFGSRSRRCLAGAALVAGLVVGLGAPVVASPESSTEAHLDEQMLKRGCGTCHRGHGKAGTPMLMESTEDSCLMCHGGIDARVREQLSPEATRQLRDLRVEFDSPFGHRLGSAELHRRNEQLPETDPGLARHVTCLDCHEAHRPLNHPLRLDGASEPAPSTLASETYLYDVCLRCHGDSANLPAGARNIRSLLHPGNRSYHPVLGPRLRVESPSLRKPWSTGGQLSCLDCHGSGDGKPGAHGSRNPGMLRATYLMADDVAESELSYGLCYRCHERQSILDDESFSLHRLHLTSPQAQTSCKTCHNAHGSREFDHLIEFDPMLVRPTRIGKIGYESMGGRAGSCTLTCHGVEHAPGNYCEPGVLCEQGVVQKVEEGQTPGRFPRLMPVFPPGFGPGSGGAP